LTISGIGDNHFRVRSCSELKIESRRSEFSIKISCNALPNIVGELSSCLEPAGGWAIPEFVSPCLADQDFQHLGIHLLIGGSSFFDVLGTRKIPLNMGSVTLYESNYRWLVMGELFNHHSHTLISMGEMIEEDWKVFSSIEVTSKTSKVNKRCLEEPETVQYFKQYTTHDEEVRFVVRLRIKQAISEISTILPMATSRILNVEKRLQNEKHLKYECIPFYE